MGIPIQTPMGATGGAGIFTAIDNSAEFGIIAAELAAITAALATMITVNQTQWGPSALAIPASPAASLAIIGSQLIDINENLRIISDKNVALQASLSEISNVMKAQTQATHALQTLQAMAVSDQIANNDFVKKETIAALKRNGIEPQPVTSVTELLKENLETATKFTVSTNFLASISSIASSCITILTNYIKTTVPVTWAQGQLDKLWSALGLNKITEAVANADETLKKKAQELKSVAQKTGVYTPGV